jgi:hypothetical protein
MSSQPERSLPLKRLTHPLSEEFSVGDDPFFAEELFDPSEQDITNKMDRSIKELMAKLNVDFFILLNLIF